MDRNIAVFGSPSSGKSVFCAALAQALTNENKRVIIISGDKDVPMAQFFCNNTNVTGMESLFKDDENIDAEKTAQAVNVIKSNSMIGVIGFSSKEKPITVDVRYEQLSVISDIANDLVDIIIWDCTSDVYCEFNKFALYQSDTRICILCADMKGLLYYNAHKNAIKDVRNMILFEGISKPYTVHEEINMQVGGFHGILPYGKEIERVCLEGNIFAVNEVCHKKYSEAVEIAINALLKSKGE